MNNNLYPFLAVAALVIIGAGTYAHVHTYAQSLNTEYAVCTSYDMPEVTAKAAYVYDLKSGTALMSKNSDAQLPLASLTKLATALVAAEALKPLSSITITEKALAPEGDSGLFAGEVWRADDLLAFTLITSSNDGARALALAAGASSLEAFIEKMNTMAQDIGAKQTFFINETGLDVSSSTAGAYGSAHDVALLLNYAYQKDQDILIGSTQSASVYTSLSGVSHTIKHTSSVAGTIQGELAVKTGFTDLAGGNLAILVEVLPGRPVAIVVLGASRETRDTDVARLAEAAREALKRATLCTKI